ncbi:MAG: sugar-binding protein, partial [Gemmatimonadota bacterium]
SLPIAVTQPAQVDVAPDSWTGPADCSWRFGVEEGPEYLYIGVEVTDERQVYKGQAPWQQDGIEVRLDARPDPERSANRGDDDAVHVFIGLSPGRTPEAAATYMPEVLDSLGVLAASRPTAKGCNYEMAIPLRYFVERQGKGWDRFRLNIAVDDFDEETGPLAQVWWQPDWRDNTNFAGSGTFQRQRR